MAKIIYDTPTQDKYAAIVAAAIAGDKKRVDEIWYVMGPFEKLGMEGHIRSQPPQTQQALKSAYTENRALFQKEAHAKLDVLFEKVKLPSPSQAVTVRAGALSTLPAAAMPPNPILRPPQSSAPAVEIPPPNLYAAAEAIRRGAPRIAGNILNAAGRAMTLAGMGEPKPAAVQGRSTGVTSYAPNVVDRVTAARTATGAAIKADGKPTMVQAQAGIRAGKIQGDLEAVFQYAMKETGVSVRVFSGGQPGKSEGGARTGSTRHDHGNAADVQLFYGGRMLSSSNPADVPIIQSFMAASVRAGATGLGAGQGNNYMGPNGFHIGFGPNGARGGPVTIWGGVGKGAPAPPEWLRTAAYAPRAVYAQLGLPVQLPTLTRTPAGGLTNAPPKGTAATNIPSLRDVTGRVFKGGEPLRKGEQSEAVKSWQQFLNREGYRDKNGNPLKEDGKFANRTREATKEYQAARGIQADGVVGRETAAKASRDNVPMPALRPGEEEIPANVQGWPVAAVAGVNLAMGADVPELLGVHTAADASWSDARQAGAGTFVPMPGRVDEANLPEWGGTLGWDWQRGIPYQPIDMPGGTPPNDDIDVTAGGNSPLAPGGVEEYDPDMLDLYNALDPPYYEEVGGGYATPGVTLGGDGDAIATVNTAFGRAQREQAAQARQEERFAEPTASMTIGGYAWNGASDQQDMAAVYAWADQQQSADQQSWNGQNDQQDLSLVYEWADQQSGPGGGPGSPGGGGASGPGGGPGRGSSDVTDIQDNYSGGSSYDYGGLGYI